MKKLSILLLLPSLLLSSCAKTQTFTILDYAHAYQTSEVQNSNRDIYLARCVGDIYVEIPDTYDLSYVEVYKTDEIIYYRIYESQFKVSDKGWKLSK